VTPLYPQKLALTSPTGGGRSVGIVRVRTKATERERAAHIGVGQKRVVGGFSNYYAAKMLAKASGRGLGLALTPA